MQPIQNISLTRNVGLEKSSGQYVAIIDDDEIADSHWIKNLISTAIKYNAHTVFGYIEAIFPQNATSWMKQREIYFQPIGNTGDKPYFFYSGNCIINAKFLRKLDIKFNPEYGLSGGEDSVFFQSLLHQGAKFVVCREAISYEVIPEYRTKLSFIFNRSIQKGNNYGRIYIESKVNSQIALIKLSVKSIIAVIYYGIRVILLYPFKKMWIYSYIDLMQNIGKISALFNYKAFIYKKNDK